MRKHSNRREARASGPPGHTRSDARRAARFPPVASSRVRPRACRKHRGGKWQQSLAPESAALRRRGPPDPGRARGHAPTAHELEVVDQDRNTVCSDKVIWVSRKTLVLPGFGVTYEREKFTSFSWANGQPQCLATTRKQTHTFRYEFLLFLQLVSLHQASKGWTSTGISGWPHCRG